MKFAVFENSKYKLTNPDWRSLNYCTLKDGDVCGVKYKPLDHDKNCPSTAYDHSLCDGIVGHIQIHSMGKDGKRSFKCFDNECHGICPDFNKLQPIEWCLLNNKR